MYILFLSIKNISSSEKKLKFIYFRKRVDHSEDIYVSNKILTLYELYIYELLKFVLRSLNQLHSETFSNDLFVFEKPKITRSDAFCLLNEPV